MSTQDQGPGSAPRTFPRGLRSRALSLGLGLALALPACGAGDEPQPTPMDPEAGFLDVRASAVVGPDYPARMFYSFRPRDLDPEHAPLAVFFNGGPGAATSGVLMAYGTGPKTLDPHGAVDQPPIDNPASWTRFANLLYLDERQAGFSHGVGEAGACQLGPAIFTSDAAEFLGALLDFLDAHPALRANPVVIVGESFGGIRSTMMLHLLQTYAGDPDGPIPDLPDVAVQVPWLKDRIQAHFDAVAGHPAGAQSPKEVARQFGTQVLIQPDIAGRLQHDVAQPLAQQDPDLIAYYADPESPEGQAAKAQAEADLRAGEHAAQQIRDPAGFEALVGVAPEAVVGLGPKTRGSSFRVFLAEDAATLAEKEAALRGKLGDLGADDAYWMPYAPACQGGEIGEITGDQRTAIAFLRLLRRTATFITDARFDGVVYSEGLPALFGMASLDVTIDRTVPAGAARPGELRFHNYVDPETGATLPLSIRFPLYDAYHEVSVGAPVPFAEDVEAWLRATALPGAY